MAQATASTTLGNSTSSPSPVVLTMRPLCSAIFGSIRSRRSAFEARQGAGLVPFHQAAVSRDIGRQDGGEPALDPL